MLGFDPKEKWIDRAIGIEISELDYRAFCDHRSTGAKKLQQLKKEGLFVSIDKTNPMAPIVYDLNQKGIYTGVNYNSDNTPILVGDIVAFEWNSHLGPVKAEVRFVAPCFVGVVIEGAQHHPLIGASIAVSSLWTKLSN